MPLCIYNPNPHPLEFQQDLGSISEEIKGIQEDSVKKNLVLKNRSAAERILGQFLDEVLIPDSLIVGICEAPLDTEYISLLDQLHTKMAFSKTPEASDSRALKDTLPQLDRLRLCAVSRCRAFLLKHMAALRQPNTNVQMLQQNVLLKYSRFYGFCKEHAPAVAEEIKTSYIDTMSRTLWSLFKAYTHALARLEEEASVESILDPRAQYETKLNVKERKLVLGKPADPPIIVHVAVSEKRRFHYEALFRSVQKHLVDSASSENVFIVHFFKPLDGFEANPVVMATFNRIFSKTLSLCLEKLENFLYKCEDVVALLLMTQVVNNHKAILQARKLECLDGYLDRLHMMLWPKLKKVFELNNKAIQSSDPVKLLGGVKDGGVHFLSTRYPRFAAALFSQSKGSGSQSVGRDLALLRASFMAKLQAMASLQKNERLKDVFLVNNYDAVLVAFEGQSNGVF